jgi:hypothetical protein
MAFIAYTAERQITHGQSLQITDKEMRLKSLVKLRDDRYILINIKSILSAYKPIINKYRKRYKITDQEEIFYEYRPTILSYDLYGTIELAPLILEMNGMVSAIEFTGLRNGIWLYENSVIDVLNDIINLEEKDKDRNMLDVKYDLSKI